MQAEKTDTIAAISTALGNGGISIVRISGAQAIEIADRVFYTKSGKKLADVHTHTIHYGHIVDNCMEIGDSCAKTEKRKILDEVMAVVMRAPKSYTTEDTVEFDCHGGAFVTRQVLQAVVRAGARMAQPGEFTKRAFLNGRIDLTEAEAVMDVIQAKNDLALKCAIGQLGGAVRQKIEDMRARILHETAYIEAVLDDPEHMDFDGYAETISYTIAQLLSEATFLLSTFDNGRMLKEGIRTVILGKPNAGKSSLLNVLSGQDRAIVTEIAGTTRDILEETIQIGGMTLLVMDTAGIRAASDAVEKIGIERAIDCAKEADLILYVADASTPLEDEDEQILKLLEGKKAIVLLNKQDLPAVTTEEMLEKRCEFPVLSVSAKRNEGIDVLETRLQEMFFAGEISGNDEIYLTNARQKEDVAAAITALRQVQESVEAGMPEDFYTIDLMHAYEALGSVIGATLEDDLADEIFGKFCMGK